MASFNRSSSRRRKLALIIGNSNYTRPENELTNANKNAEVLRALLKTMNFNVTMYKNVSQEDEMMESIQNFKSKIKHGDLVFFYFSGHACQINNENYLIPIGDDDIDDDENLKELANNFQRILGRLINENLQYATILILDCCRPYLLNNESTSNSEMKDNGLHQMNATDRTFIQFSCPANETATDEFFSKHLLKNIDRRNVGVIDIFQRIANDVCLERYKEQRPWSTNGLSEYEHIYLNQVMSCKNKKRASSKKNLSNRRKWALIIGNDKYCRKGTELTTSVKNAEKLSAVLEEINFDVTMDKNVSQEDKLMESLKTFESKIKLGDVVLFYFSGHACQVNGKNYLIPVDNTRIDDEENIEALGTEVERILERLREKKKSCVIILILDCCRPYLLTSESTPNSELKDDGLHEMEIEESDRTFIQFSCPANETANDDFFIKHLLKNISQENVDINEIFQRIADDVCLERYKNHRPLSIDGLSEYGHIYLNPMISSLPNIPYNTIWKINARTVTGGRGPGSTMNRLHCPKGIFLTQNQTVLIADSLNHRIMSYNPSTGSIQRIAGKNIQGYGPDLLAEPSNVIFDKISKSFIICDYHNRRVLRWFPRSKTCAKTIVRNVACFGLAMDDEGSLYVSDIERHEVRRYRAGKKYGRVVAGGHGGGSRLKQLNHPTYICVGDEQSVYVSDSWNDRVVRWDKGAKEGVIVAGGKGKGKNRQQLDYPAGVLVDQMGTVYVADHWNHRVMRWYKGASEGDIIAGDPFLPGSQPNQLICPEGLAFDRHGNLYVADSNNHRIQRFNIKTI